MLLQSWILWRKFDVQRWIKVIFKFKKLFKIYSQSNSKEYYFCFFFSRCLVVYSAFFTVVFSVADFFFLKELNLLIESNQVALMYIITMSKRISINMPWQNVTFNWTLSLLNILFLVSSQWHKKWRAKRNLIEAMISSK